MSTTKLTSPHVTCIQRALVLGLITILILTALVLIASTILGRLLPTTRDGYQADRIPVVQNVIRPNPVPIPRAANIRLFPSGTPILTPLEASRPSVLSMPVPSPPS
jgi:hypothetical protein